MSYLKLSMYLYTLIRIHSPPQIKNASLPEERWQLGKISDPPTAGASFSLPPVHYTNNSRSQTEGVAHHPKSLSRIALSLQAPRQACKPSRSGWLLDQPLPDCSTRLPLCHHTNNVRFRRRKCEEMFQSARAVPPSASRLHAKHEGPHVLDGCWISPCPHAAHASLSVTTQTMSGVVRGESVKKHSKASEPCRPAPPSPTPSLHAGPT